VVLIKSPFVVQPSDAPAPFRPLSANERQLLKLIRRVSPISRAELARRTGLALPTVSRLADQLLTEGLIVADDKVMMSRMGQPSLPLSIAPQGAFAFGIVVRADVLSVSLAHLSGTIVASTEEPHEGTTREAIVARIAAIIPGLAAEGQIPLGRVCGIGLALPGFFIDSPRRINAPLGMEDWATADLERDLGTALGLPVLVENDGSAATLGEYTYGCGVDRSSLAYLYVDRGLGGGLVIDGKLVTGARGNAGEFTGMLAPSARADRPTLALLADLVASGQERPATLGAMVRTLDPHAPVVDAWIERVAPAADAIVSAIGAIVDPQAIVIGGRLPRAIAARLIERLNFYSVPVRGRDRIFPDLVPSAVDGDAASLGASACCFERLFF
jgi:predicted NBD/HSP70 family sugar kinase